MPLFSKINPPLKFPAVLLKAIVAFASLFNSLIKLSSTNYNPVSFNFNVCFPVKFIDKIEFFTKFKNCSLDNSVSLFMLFSKTSSMISCFAANLLFLTFNLALEIILNMC